MSDSRPTADGRPIGVFDSGVGGLTVAAALMRHLPTESILYLGDTARLPYGTKSADTVRRYTRRNIDFLLARGVKGVVVACNTASALAIEEHPDDPLPIWGVIEPGAQAAVAASHRKVGVLATESTVRSGAYAHAIHRHRPELEVLSQPCPLFVPLVEEGWSEDPVTELVARRYLEPLLDAGVDTLVLGCTHYPVLAPLLQRIAGPEVVLVDSAEVVARRVAEGFDHRGLRSGSETVSHHFCVTDTAERFGRIADDLLLGIPSPPEGWSLELVEV